jgi:hypothetical protein
LQHRFLFGDRRIPYPSTVLHFTLELTEPRPNLSEDRRSYTINRDMTIALDSNHGD